jgi:monoamine oxidase
MPKAWKKALRGFEPSYVERLNLEFEPALVERVFSEDVSIISSPDLRFKTWWGTRPVHSGMITAWAGGDAALNLSGLMPSEKTEIALSDFSKLSKTPLSKLRSGFVQSFQHDWTHDPFSLSAYSYLASGASSAASELARSVEGTLFFGGEAIDEEHSGTVEGALRSGRKAVQKIIRAKET